MASTTINDYYSVGTDHTEIVLKIMIENTQLSKSTVRLNKQLLGEYNDSFSVTLGKAKDIVGSILYINTTEADIDPDSDLISFGIEISGGMAPYKNYKSQTILAGGYVIYSAEIALIP